METTYSSTKSELLLAELPKETRTYKPVPHSQLMDITLESINASGFKLDKEIYTSAKEGKVANGRFSISNVADTEMQLQIGWQNSYDKSLSLKFAIGTHIFICSNGCVSGDHGSFKKKHVGEIREFAPETISEYIKRSSDVFRKIQKEREFMKTIEIDRKVQAELLGRMFLEQNIITSTQLNIIKRELDTPTFDYKSENSMWELYQFTTFALKESHPSNWMEAHIKTHEFFTDYIDIDSKDVSPLILESV